MYVKQTDQVRYASINVGDPPQILEFDLDMLSPDFYLISTTEIDRVGSKYDSFTSKSHGMSSCQTLKLLLTLGQAGSEDRVHPECRLPTDLLHLTNMTLSASISLRIPMCGPPKYSRRTLTPSGNVLGLAPSRAMAQTSHSSLVELLSEVLPEKLWSIALLDTQSGILSIGSTTAPHFEEAKIRTQLGLQNLEKQGVDVTAVNQEIQTQIDASRLKDWHDYFRWSDVQGAVGWWTTLMQGVWVNGAKTLKNQPVLFDIQMPFILAPPLAASRFYEAISGSKRLDKPFDMFFAFPCLNPPSVAFEFDGWRFPTMTGQWSNVKASKETSGGKFSLGQEKPGSGYCIGLVVETSAGLSHDADTHGSRTNEAAANGLRDLWIIGEPFFRGIGLVFDVGEQKIGFRSY